MTKVLVAVIFQKFLCRGSPLVGRVSPVDFVWLEYYDMSRLPKLRLEDVKTYLGLVQSLCTVLCGLSLRILLEEHKPSLSPVKAKLEEYDIGKAVKSSDTGLQLLEKLSSLYFCTQNEETGARS